MRIVCFGDSNTYGYDPRAPLGGRYDAQSRWVDMLAEKTGWQVRNRGENGRTIPGRYEQVERLLKANAPVDIFLVMLGTNDLLQGTGIREVTDRMEAFLIHVRPLCKQILLVAPPPMQYGQWVTDAHLLDASVQLGEAFRKISQKLNISFADAGQWNVEIAFDGVHFTEKGNRIFAEGLTTRLIGK